MKTNEIIIAIVVALVFYFRPLDSKPTCPPGWYYDAVVGRCSPCTDICLNAAIQRTEKECRRKCPNFEAAGKLKHCLKCLMKECMQGPRACHHQTKATSQWSSG